MMMDDLVELHAGIDTKGYLVSDVRFLAELMLGNGYMAARPIGSGRYACVRPLMFTAAIIVGRIGDEIHCEDRWCYHTQEAAREALSVWDGTGEPGGWHRQPGTGRRLAETDDCYDGNNQLVPIGTIYVRR